MREHLSLADFCDGPQHRLTSLAGGVPLCLEGRTVGGVGISGRKPAEDEVLAGLKAAGLEPVEVMEKRGWVCIICEKKEA